MSSDNGEPATSTFRAEEAQPGKSRIRLSDNERPEDISISKALTTLTSNDSGIPISTAQKTFTEKAKKKKLIADEFVCTDCGTLDSPIWRTGPHGWNTLCNACGLRWAKKERKKQIENATSKSLSFVTTGDSTRFAFDDATKLANGDDFEGGFEPIILQVIDNRNVEAGSVEHAEIEDWPDLQEHGIITSLFQACLKNFQVLLKLPLTGDSASKFEGQRMSFGVAEQYQVESLQRDFLRFAVWGEEFHVTDGKLDTGLEYAEGLKEDVVLVLLHLCDALYQGLRYFTQPDTLAGTQQLDTVRLLEIAQSYIEENVYLGIDGSSFPNIVDEIAIATEGLGDLSFCLEKPAMDLFAAMETPRAPSEVTAAESHHVYEEIIRHRFPKADPAVISQHATANYIRFIRLQRLRRNQEFKTLEGEVQTEGKSRGISRVHEETKTMTCTMFHDSGIGTYERHKSSYAKSLMSFTNRSGKEPVELLPKMGALGKLFECNVCLRSVQFQTYDLWKTHIIEDLVPYICIFEKCVKAIEPFQNRNSWLDHIDQAHFSDIDGKVMICALCKDFSSKDHLPLITHVEKHLLEIAYSIMPSDDDPEPVEDKVGETSHQNKDQKSSIPTLRLPPEFSVANRSFSSSIFSQPAETPKAPEDYPRPDPGQGPDDEDYRPRTRPRKPTGAMLMSPLLPDTYPSLPDLSDMEIAQGKHNRIGNRAKSQPLEDEPRVSSSGVKSRSDRPYRSLIIDTGYGEQVTRPFSCIFSFYGCWAKFASKSEWKRHISTQHIKLGFWRCDLCGYPVDPMDGQPPNPNDFNRKDLFTQHLRRMHSTPWNRNPEPDKTEYPVTEDNISDHQKRCFQSLRRLPRESTCLFCERNFTGPDSWEDYVEHIGRHLEKDRKDTRKLSPQNWKHGEYIEKYLLEEGLIVRGKDGEWKIGDGHPLRLRAAQDTDGEVES